MKMQAHIPCKLMLSKTARSVTQYRCQWRTWCGPDLSSDAWLIACLSLLPRSGPSSDRASATVYFLIPTPREWLPHFFTFFVVRSNRNSDRSDVRRRPLEVPSTAVDLLPHRRVSRPRICSQVLVILTVLQKVPPPWVTYNSGMQRIV